MGTPSKLGFNLDPTFFGYDTTYSVHIHSLIFDMIWYSDGRFDWDTLYYMPIYLRDFYLKKLNQKIEERNNK